MSIGTKSILFGYHQFVIHPIVLFVAWWKLYGFPYDPRLWVAFVVHDLGYWGKPNMDGDEGETHVLFGANLMRRWFGDDWGDFCLYHSRFYAKKAGKPFSRLCIADKLAIVIDPKWLHLFRIRLSGEVYEYMNKTNDPKSKYAGENRRADSVETWHADLVAYLDKWIPENKSLAQDRVLQKG